MSTRWRGIGDSIGGGLGGLGGGSSPRDRRTMNSDPWPSPALCTAMLPPCSSMSWRASVSPTPSPDFGPRASGSSTCTNMSKMLSCLSGAMPTPVSLKCTTHSSGVSSRRTEMRPPSSVYFDALLSRFANTCARRVASPCTNTGPSGRSSASE